MVKNVSCVFPLEKMIEYSMALPNFIIEKQGLMNPILRLEQEAELHHQISYSMERKYKHIYTKKIDTSTCWSQENNNDVHFLHPLCDNFAKKYNFQHG